MTKQDVNYGDSVILHWTLQDVRSAVGLPLDDETCRSLLQDAYLHHRDWGICNSSLKAMAESRIQPRTVRLTQGITHFYQYFEVFRLLSLLPGEYTCRLRKKGYLELVLSVPDQPGHMYLELTKHDLFEITEYQFVKVDA